MGQDINQEALNQDLIRGINLLNHDIRDAHSLKLVCDALNNGADIDAPNHNGITLLMMACQKGADSLVEWILESHHPDVNLSNSFGVTALYHACGLCNLSTVKRLVEKGADINQDIQGSSALFYSIDMQQTPDIANFLIESGADIHKINSSGESVLFPTLGTAISAINNQEFFSEINESIEPCLALIGSLIEKGLDINYKDNNGETLLIKSVKGNCFETLELLIGLGADLSIRNSQGQDAMSITQHGMQGRVFDYLKKIITKQELEASSARESGIDSTFKLQR